MLLNENDLKEIGTKLGDIIAYLSNTINNSDIKIYDVEMEYKLTNELYTKFINFDEKK